MRRLRPFVPAIVFLLGTLLISGVRPRIAVQPAAPLRTLAVDVQGYTSEERVIDDEERRVAGVSDYVMRVFRRDSTTAISVYVGYYERQARGQTIHSPKNCLPGAGWEIVTAGTVEVAHDGGSRPVNRFLLGNGANRAVVYYWYQGRGRVEADEYRVKWNLLRDAALTGRTEEALVRIVVPVVEPANATPREIERIYADADVAATALAEQVLVAVARVMPTRRGAYPGAASS
jgi:EpsI family protein